MLRLRQRRKQVKPATVGESAPAGTSKVPKTFVVKSGTVGNSVAALTKDVRRVLEPNTASRLRERKANRLRDYVSMSGPLGVTHLVVFSQPSASSVTLPKSASAEKDDVEGTAADRAEKSLIDGTTTLNLRLIRLPRGPTLSFKVLRYSLAQDVLRAARRPRAVGREFAEGPLVSAANLQGAAFSWLTPTLIAHSQRIRWRRQAAQAHDDRVSESLPSHSRSEREPRQCDTLQHCH